MNDLPICQYRTALKDDKIHCAHTLIHAPNDLVTYNMCMGCHWLNVPCDNPRPKPNQDLIIESIEPLSQEDEQHLEEDKPPKATYSTKQLQIIKKQVEVQLQRMQADVMQIDYRLTQQGGCNCGGNRKPTPEEVSQLEQRKQQFQIKIEKYKKYLSKFS